MKVDGFTINDLKSENNNIKIGRKLDGKPFWQIQKEVDHNYFYLFVYGVGSDAVHQEILDYYLATEGKWLLPFFKLRKMRLLEHHPSKFHYD